MNWPLGRVLAFTVFMFVIMLGVAGTLGVAGLVGLAVGLGVTTLLVWAIRAALGGRKR